MLSLFYKLRSIIKHDISILAVHLINMYFKGLIKIDFSGRHWKISITHLGKERFSEVINSLNLKSLMSM